MNDNPYFQSNLASMREPLFIDLEPAYGCNLRCRMCHVTYMKDKNLPKFIDSKSIDWGFVRDKDVSLGSEFEPTMHPAFDELIGCLNKENAQISLVTNGFNLSPDKFSNLYNARLNIINLSFDGATQEKYEYIRQRSQYERVLSNIQNLIKLRQNSETIFMINFTVCKYNLDEIIPAIDLWDSMGAHTLNLIAMVSREKEPFFVENSLFDVREDFNKSLEAAVDYLMKKSLQISLISPYFSKPEIREKYANYFVPPSAIALNKHRISEKSQSLYRYYGYGKSIIPHKTCRAPLTTVRIDYDANVYVCKSTKIGNLYENTFEEIWNSSKHHQIISQLIANPKQCNACDYFKFGINFETIDYEESDYFISQYLSGNSLNPRIQLITEGYQGFNLLKVGNQFYGIPQGEGDFNLDRIANQDYSIFYQAKDESNLREQIRRERDNSEIQLIAEGYQRFNLLKVGGTFYGIPQGEGDFNLDRIANQDYSIFYQAEDEFSLREQIRRERDNSEIQLIAEGYQGFNLLKVGGTFYGIPQGEGDFNFERMEEQDYSVSFKAENQSVLYQQITEYWKRSPPSSQNLLKTILNKGLNLFRQSPF